MSFQILDIVVYGFHGEVRRLPFQPGKVNIVTGLSKTGKTAIIDIIDYCLGGEKCTVPVGVIRDSVSWYALRLKLETGEAFVARRAPKRGQASSAECFYEVGATLDIPRSDDLRGTTNTDTLISLLSKAAGIAENIHEPPPGQTRAPIAANIRHAVFFLFLQQDEIGSRKLLFHRQGDPFIPQAIKDVLPFFLGAVGDDYLSKKEELRRWREKLRDAERRLAEVEAIRGEGTTKATSLLAEARDIGLTESPPPTTWDEAIVRLRTVLTKPIESEDEIAASGDALQALMVERNALSETHAQVKEELEYARSAIAAAGGFAKESGEQLSRLRSIEVFGADEQEGSHCPLCSSTVEAVDPMLRAAVHTVASQIEGVAHQSPQLQRLVAHLERRSLELRRALTRNREAMEAVSSSDDRIGSLRDIAARRALVIGRVSLYVESVKKGEDAGPLKKSVAELKKKVEELDTALSDEKLQDKLMSTLSLLGIRMTEWGKRLQLEHSENALRLDMRIPTVIVDTPDGPVPMAEVGSWSNWLGYHLITFLAIHEWFVKRQRPVPRFVLFDQPAQGYFPADKDVEGADQSLDAIPDGDREAALGIFRFIFDVVESLAPGLQVIITEHADLKEPWFSSAIVERWRGGAALIPSGWKPAPPTLPLGAPATSTTGKGSPAPATTDVADPVGEEPGTKSAETPVATDADGGRTASDPKDEG